MVQDGMGWIIVDALDTLMLMNLTTELTHARQWMSTSLSCKSWSRSWLCPGLSVVEVLRIQWKSYHTAADGLIPEAR